PLELHVGPRLRIRTSVRPHRLVALRIPPVEPGRLLARGLVVDEDAVLDDVEVFGHDAFVIPADRRQRAELRPVATHIREIRTMTELAEHLLRRREEARAGVVRLGTHYAVQLGGMRNALVK